VVTRMHRATFRYRGYRDPRTELRIRIREIAQTRVRDGYRKILVLLNREGWKVGKTLVQWLYQEEGLVLKDRPKRRRRAAEHRPERIANHGSEPGLKSGFCGGSTDGWTALPSLDDRGCIRQRKFGDRGWASIEGSGCGGRAEPEGLSQVAVCGSLS
jgi:putative transposase